MKQDAMDVKITKRCKTCEKQCMQKDLDRSRNSICWAAIEQKSTSMDRESIEDLSSKQKVSRWIENLSRSYRDKVQKSRWIEIAITSIETRRKKGLDRLKAVKRYQEVVEMLKNSFSKKRKTQIWMQLNMLLNQRSKQHFKLSKTSLNKNNVKHLDPKHTHTHKKQV